MYLYHHYRTSNSTKLPYVYGTFVLYEVRYILKLNYEHFLNLVLQSYFESCKNHFFSILQQNILSNFPGIISRIYIYIFLSRRQPKSVGGFQFLLFFFLSFFLLLHPFFLKSLIQGQRNRFCLGGVRILKKIIILKFQAAIIYGSLQILPKAFF